MLSSMFWTQKGKVMHLTGSAPDLANIQPPRMQKVDLRLHPISTRFLLGYLAGKLRMGTPAQRGQSLSTTESGPAKLSSSSEHMKPRQKPRRRRLIADEMDGGRPDTSGSSQPRVETLKAAVDRVSHPLSHSHHSKPTSHQPPQSSIQYAKQQQSLHTAHPPHTKDPSQQQHPSQPFVSQSVQLSADEHEVYDC